MSQERGRSRSIGAEPWLPSVRRLAASVRLAAFWLAVALPLAYPAVLFGGADRFAVIGGLLAVHVAALSVGHAHRQG